MTNATRRIPIYLTLLTLAWLVISGAAGSRGDWFGCILFLLVAVFYGAHSWRAVQSARSAAVKAEKQRSFARDFYDL